MSHTQILFRDDARAKLLAGASTLADAVRVTLGPKSKSVLIEKKFGAPLVCNDGVTIVKEVHLSDHEENLGAQMLREAAIRTSDDVGDGTTTSTLLAHALYSEGLRNVVAGSSAIDLRHGIDRGVAMAVEELKKIARPVVSRTEREQMARSPRTTTARSEARRRRTRARGPGRRRLRRGCEGHGDFGRRRRRVAVRSRIPLRVLRDEPGEDGSRPRLAADSPVRQEDLEDG
jgi:chaperonin GroEL (HSP60 family)